MSRKSVGVKTYTLAVLSLVTIGIVIVSGIVAATHGNALAVAGIAVVVGCWIMAFLWELGDA